MYYFLAKLWSFVLVDLIVVGESIEGGLVVLKVREPGMGGTRAERAMQECVSFGDVVVEALATVALSFLLGG